MVCVVWPPALCCFDFSDPHFVCNLFVISNSQRALPPLHSDVGDGNHTKINDLCEQSGMRSILIGALKLRLIFTIS